jgi:periplasmic protein TonB
MEGQPVVAFTLNKGGGLMKADLAQTSGYQLLDRAALEAVHQAAPYPEIPVELKTDTYQFKLPISFVLK